MANKEQVKILNVVSKYGMSGETTKTLPEIFLPSLSLFCIFQVQLKSFIIPENKMNVELPFIFCKLPEWLNGDRGLSVFEVVSTERTLQAKL